MTEISTKALFCIFLIIYLSYTQSILGSYRVQRIRSAPSRDRSAVKISADQITIKGCNTMWGSYKYNSNTKKFSVKDFASTLIGCPPESQDFKITKALQLSATATRQAQFLIFKSSGAQTLRLSSSGPRASGDENDQVQETDFTVETQQQPQQTDNLIDGQDNEQQAFNDDEQNTQDGEDAKNPEQSFSQQDVNEDSWGQLPQQLPQLVQDDSPQDGDYAEELPQQEQDEN